MARYASLLAFLLIVGAAATTGSKFMPGPWYESLAKPSWTPPNWLFPIAWTVLYIMIAVAGWRVWQAEGFGVALAVWGVSLVLNALWSYLMFGSHRIDLALADVGLLLASIIAFILLARHVDGWAALLFAPYLVWVSFATALNYAVLQLNPGASGT